MASEKKSEKERSVEDRLKALYQLQTILSEIDRIKFLRGELPNEVKDLEDEIIRYQTRIQKHTDEIESLRDVIAGKKKDIEERRVKIARYDDQIDNVRNNREFATMSRALRRRRRNSMRSSARPVRRRRTSASRQNLWRPTSTPIPSRHSNASATMPATDWAS